MSVTCFCVTKHLVRKFEAEPPTLRFQPPLYKKSGAYRDLVLKFKLNIPFEMIALCLLFLIMVAFLDP